MTNDFVWLAVLVLLAFVGLFSILLVAWIVIGGWLDAMVPIWLGRIVKWRTREAPE